MKPSTLNYDEIIDRALEAIPEIKSAYETESARWTVEKMGPYNLFDVVLMPRVRELLKSSGHDAELRRIFSFFEALMNQSDQRIRDLVGVGVCEDLCSDEAALQKACAFMGPATRRSCDEYLA